jgi:histidinol-phosphate aminotransferase
MLSKLLKTLIPYTAGEQPKGKTYIKLNTNENAYPPSPRVAEVLSGFDAEKLRLYPDPECAELRGALAEKYGVEPRNIFVGNGSDEILGFCFPAFFDTDGAPILFPDVTYSFYPVYANLYRIPYKTPRLNDDYTINIDDYMPKNPQENGTENGGTIPRKNTENDGCQGIIIANPNAPTGILLSVESIRKILEKNPEKVVIIDEAYADFSGVSVVPLIKKYENLLVVRTFSKSYSLAGIRCGYAVGQQPLIDALNVVKNSFNSYTLDSLTLKIAAAACKDGEYYDMINERIINIRDAAAAKLREGGFTVLNSSSNFLFVKKDGISGEYLFSELKKNGILARRFAGGRTEDFIRVTIGTDAETEKFLNRISLL